MDYDKIISDLDDIREYINNTITDVQTVCEYHTDDKQVKDGLCWLSEAAKNIIGLVGYYLRTGGK